MKRHIRNDNLMHSGGHCALCGRYFDINEVVVGVYTEYFLLRNKACPCPTCFGHQLHRVQDPTLDDVLDRLKFCDLSPRNMMTRASVWLSYYKVEDPGRN
jgi:hypothetical protein